VRVLIFVEVRTCKVVLKRTFSHPINRYLIKLDFVRWGDYVKMVVITNFTTVYFIK